MAPPAPQQPSEISPSTWAQDLGSESAPPMPSQSFGPGYVDPGSAPSGPSQSWGAGYVNASAAPSGPSITGTAFSIPSGSAAPSISDTQWSIPTGSSDSTAGSSPSFNAGSGQPYSDSPNASFNAGSGQAYSDTPNASFNAGSADPYNDQTAPPTAGPSQGGGNFMEGVNAAFAAIGAGAAIAAAEGLLSGSGSSSAVPTKPTSAVLKVASGADIPLFVNPHTVKIKKGHNTRSTRSYTGPSSSSRASGGAASAAVGPTSYLGAAPGKLTLHGSILASSAQNTDISPQMDELFACLVPKGTSGASSPPAVTFSWGAWSPFASSYLSKLQIDVSNWNANGAPIRATITVLELTELGSTTAGQNPTSGAFGSRQTHTVIAGDSLASISYSAYGRADYWRAIADVNGIDDPMRIRPGTELLIPATEVARAGR